MAAKSAQEPIHSGHFMTSNPHSDELLPDEEVVEVVVPEEIEDPMQDEEQKDQNLRNLNVQDEKPVTFYKFGPKKTQSIAIDVSLNKLNKCIKVAYNKMTTPKWKDFKGLRLHWKQRIRLNNVIWRAYYMEFRRPDRDKSRRIPYCYFSVPDDDVTHTRLEGAVMEGMYWKRGIDTLKAQYKRWRHFRTKKKGRRRGMSTSYEMSTYLKHPVNEATPKNSSTKPYDADEFENEFTDTLFESLMQPYTFPNPKEIAQGCNADVMQPGLLSLQPSIEEIMASLEPPDTSAPETEPANSPTVSSPLPFGPKEYEATYTDYTVQAQQQPTRQSSSISPQILLANASAPTYSQAAYDHVPPLVATVPYVDSSNLDYVPQFLTGTTPTSATSLPSRSWWMNFPPTPASSLLSSPSTPSVVHSPTNLNTAAASPHSLNSPATVSPFISVTDASKVNTSSKNTLKAYPSPTESLKLSHERWTLPGSPLNDDKLIALESSLQDRMLWKHPSPSTSLVLHPLPVPQPLYPTMSTHIMTSTTIPLDTTVPMPSGSGIVSVKKEDKEERHARPSKRKCRTVAADSTIEPMERKRLLHLNAEQNRRCALKDGFEQLLNMLPNMHAGGVKPTNAVVLARAAERIRELKSNIRRDSEKIKQLKHHVLRLDSKIKTLQASLPCASQADANAVNQKTQMEQFLERYIKERSRQDYRFWVMTRMMQPMLEGFIEELTQVSSSNIETVLAATNEWLRSNWHPSSMRPNASTLLVYLATHTSMLTDPNGLQERIQRELSRH